MYARDEQEERVEREKKLNEWRGKRAERSYACGSVEMRGKETIVS